MMNGLQRKKIPSSQLIFVGLKIMRLFNVDAIRAVPFKDQETQASPDNMVSSQSYKRKHNELASTQNLSHKFD